MCHLSSHSTIVFTHWKCYCELLQYGNIQLQLFSARRFELPRLLHFALLVQLTVVTPLPAVEMRCALLWPNHATSLITLLKKTHYCPLISFLTVHLLIAVNTNIDLSTVRSVITGRALIYFAFVSFLPGSRLLPLIGPEKS